MTSIPTSGAPRLCIGCGVISPRTVDLRPEGWAIVPIYGRIGKARAVVGEKAYCPDCQSSGKAVAA